MKALKKWFPLIALISGIVAAAMIFLPCVKSGESVTGLEVAFGKEEKALETSFVHIIMYLIAIASGVAAFMGAKKGNKFQQIAAIVGFALAMIFFFINKNFVQWNGLIPKEIQKEMNKALDLAIGSIFGGIACLVGLAASVANVVVKDE